MPQLPETIEALFRSWNIIL